MTALASTHQASGQGFRIQDARCMVTPRSPENDRVAGRDRRTGGRRRDQRDWQFRSPDVELLQYLDTFITAIVCEMRLDRACGDLRHDQARDDGPSASVSPTRRAGVRVARGMEVAEAEMLMAP